MIKLEAEVVFKSGKDFDYSELIKVLKKARRLTISLTPIKEGNDKQ